MLTNISGYDKAFEVPCKKCMSMVAMEGPCNKNEFFDIDKHHNSQVDLQVPDHRKLHKHLRTVQAKYKSQNDTNHTTVMHKLPAKMCTVKINELF